MNMYVFVEIYFSAVPIEILCKFFCTIYIIRYYTDTDTKYGLNLKPYFKSGTVSYRF